MCFIRIPICVFLILALLSAETPKLPEPYQSIAELARGAPVEFAADALLRLVESGKIGNQDAKGELVSEAFRLAAAAKFKVRMRKLPGSIPDTRSSALSNAYDLKLDVLSLQSRAVADMVPIDKAKARELFREIVRPSLPALTCDDPLVYDVADFYQTLGIVANATFTAEERAKEEHLNFLLDYLAQAATPAALAPLARVIQSAAVTPDQSAILWNRFNGLLETMQPDDRSFSAAAPEIAKGVNAGTQESFLKFLQRSKGCPDDGSPGVSLDLSRGPVQAGNTPHVESYWQSAEAKRLLEDGQRLRIRPDGKLVSEAERSTREWQQQLTDYLAAMAAWTSAQEKSEADYYHQKCVVYEALVELIPPGPQRDKTLEAYVNFVSNSNLQSNSPAEWFMHAHSMLDRVRSTSSGEPAKMLAAFETSGNRSLALYAALEKAFGGGLPAWVTKSN
ncbi:MAG TPA: hypothetical protein VGV35_14755 [Bryobacteraceae bacterium]|nr:hypothetical protein [Bryobacteraceae bacterium]